MSSGERIIQARGEMRASELARLIGESRQRVYAWERGGTKLGVEYAKRIAAVTGVTAEWLLGLSDEMEIK